MALKVEMVTFDCADPEQLASWWAEQFDGKTQVLIPAEFVAVIRSEGPRLGFQKVPDPTPEKTACTSISARPIWTSKFRDLRPPVLPR